MAGLFVDATDIQLLYDFHIQYSREKLSKIKKELGKKVSDNLTIQEFSNYAGVEPGYIVPIIRSKNKIILKLFNCSIS